MRLVRRVGRHHAPRTEVARERLTQLRTGLPKGMVIDADLFRQSHFIESSVGNVREALPDTPILIGSGTSAENCPALLSIANGVIVASSLKRQGQVENPIDVDKVRTLVKAVQDCKLEA